MILYTHEQVMHLLKVLVSDIRFPCFGEQGEVEYLPIEHVDLCPGNDTCLLISLHLQGGVHTSVLFKLDEPLIEKFDYVAEVQRTSVVPDTQHHKLTLGAFGLAGESGEVVDAIKKWLFHGHMLDSLKLLEELGDVLWYITLMCSAFGWTLDDAIDLNVKKLRARYPDGFEAERSITF